MSDDKPRDTPAPQAGDETQPVRAEGAAPAASAPAPAEPTPAASAEPAPAGPVAPRRGFRERLRSVGRSGGSRTFGLAALIASALAGIIVGGLGVAAVGAITDDHDRGAGRGGWVQRDDDRGPGDRGGMRGGPRRVPGQLPPTTASEDDEGSVS